VELAQLDVRALHIAYGPAPASPAGTGVRAAVADHLGRAPTRAELTAARRAAHGLAAIGRARVLHVPGADGNDNAGDRNHLVLAKPNVIMNEVQISLGLWKGDSVFPSRIRCIRHRSPWP
jgi:hypothetical protein